MPMDPNLKYNIAAEVKWRGSATDFIHDVLKWLDAKGAQLPQAPPRGEGQAFTTTATTVKAEGPIGVCRCWCGGPIMYPSKECGSCGKKPTQDELMEMQAAANRRAAERGLLVSTLPQDPAARVQVVMEMLEGVPVVDEHGRPTGERSGPLITREKALELLDLPDLPEKA